MTLYARNAILWENDETLYDEVLYGDGPARASTQSVEERAQQFGDRICVGAGERPLLAADSDESEARITVLRISVNTTSQRTAHSATACVYYGYGCRNWRGKRSQ